MIRVADFVINFLEDLGVTTIFTVTGGGSIFLCDAVGRNPRMTYYACHHEQAVAIATEGYARASGKLGVSLVTTYRGSFSEQIQKGGVDGLVKTLAERNRSPEPPKPPTKSAGARSETGFLSLSVATT